MGQWQRVKSRIASGALIRLTTAMPWKLGLIFAVGRTLFSVFARPFDAWRRKQQTRRKLYSEAANIYNNLVKRIWSIERSPELEEGLRERYDTVVSAEYYRIVRGNVELFTDLDADERDTLDKVFTAYTSIPTQKAHERYFFARWAVLIFEDFFLRNILDQKLVLSVSRKPAKALLEVMVRGDRDSAIDSTEHPEL
jgi:hypothetical protein